MGTKKTIAIVGLTNGQESPLLRKLALNNRLLLVSNRPDNFTEPFEHIQEKSDKGAIELVNCAQDGCWEADIIILQNGFQQETKELEKLQIVATQKIVVFITETEVNNSKRLLFPHSKIITIEIKPDIKEVTVKGDDLEALQKITELINSTDYYYASDSSTSI
jgi:hypothetical protein